MTWERPHIEQSTEEGKATVPSAHVKLRLWEGVITEGV